MQCPACAAVLPTAVLDESSGRCHHCGSSFEVALSLTDTWNVSDTPNTTKRETFAEPDINLSNGRFSSLVRVGVGGFGTVYKAFDIELQRTVALKVPHTSRLQHGASRERFVREARHLAQLRHPSIVPIYDVSAESDGLVLITEYLEGETLAATLQRRRLGPDQAAGLCTKLAEALHHAHENGIVHRDVKPGNVMVDQDGNPFLMDFGLAKHETTDNTLSVEGQLLGTPAYMSPEQAVGSLKNVDRRSDVYSLGVVLYEMLTSERPFRGEPHLLVYQVLHNEPPRPRSLNDQIPYDLEMVCLRAMSKQPQDRYPTTLAFAEDLERYLAREPVHAAPANMLDRIRLWCRKPARIHEASTIAMAMFLMLALWEGVSLTMLAIGILPVEDRLGTALVITTGLISFTALAGIAYAARSRISLALWFGFVASVVLLGFSLLCFTGVMQIDGLSAPEVRIPVFSFFSIAAVFILVAHLISLTAYYANRDVIRWAKQVPDSTGN